MKWKYIYKKKICMVCMLDGYKIFTKNCFWLMDTDAIVWERAVKSTLLFVDTFLLHFFFVHNDVILVIKYFVYGFVEM